MRWHAGLMVLDGQPRFVYNYLGSAETIFDANRLLPVGRCTVTFAFEKNGAPDTANGYGAPGVAHLFIDEEEVASGPLTKTTPVMLNFSGSLTCGYHHAEPFASCEPPFIFSDVIRRVDVWTHGTAPIDEVLATEVWLKRQ